ncbi:MAG: tryptophan synthase subunit beta, partial [bacterium]|nr:tryptophan synthase subunit beta [bacterium]
MVKIKICGLTDKEDYKQAVALGADYTGFIFYPGSPRYIDKYGARAIVAGEGGSHKKVGVFVNESAEKVREIYDYVGLDLVQLHGDESPEYCESLGLPYWKVIRVKDKSSLDTMDLYKCRVFLLDTFSPAQYGGTGKVFNPDLARGAIEKGNAIVVAGGISPENIAEISALMPYAVDVCSGVEREPGKKDMEKMKRLFAAARPQRDAGSQKADGPTAKGSPDSHRYFGRYGGRYVPEMLVPALDELEAAYSTYKDSADFREELTHLFNTYAGRPTPLYFAENLTNKCKGAKIYLKLESLTHTGAHKINNVLGQALLARRMNKSCIVAETGAGQHGVATASVAAKFGLKCKVFMGVEDIRRQYPNVFSMKMLGAEVVPVPDGTGTLKDAVNAALKYWIQHLDDTYYLLGSALGPAPYPTMVRDFQSIIGREVREQIMNYEGRLPDSLVACVGGGSNSIGLFHPFLEDEGVEMFGVEAGGRGKLRGEHAVRFGENPTVGVLQGYKSYFIQDQHGQVQPTHSISAGLDYAGIGPELAQLHDIKRINFAGVRDDEALAGYRELCRSEGIIPALESSHAVAYCLKLAPTLPKDSLMVVNISGRGDKDLFITADAVDHENWHRFLQDASGGP